MLEKTLQNKKLKESNFKRRGRSERNFLLWFNGNIHSSTFWVRLVFIRQTSEENVLVQIKSKVNQMCCVEIFLNKRNSKMGNFLTKTEREKCIGQNYSMLRAGELRALNEMSDDAINLSCYISMIGIGLKVTWPRLRCIPKILVSALPSDVRRDGKYPRVVWAITYPASFEAHAMTYDADYCESSICSGLYLTGRKTMFSCCPLIDWMDFSVEIKHFTRVLVAIGICFYSQSVLTISIKVYVLISLYLLHS